MRLPRYQQSESYTDRGAGVFQTERLVSPLETIGTLGANILQESATREYNAWIQSQAANAQTKIYELADDFTNRINNDEILDSKTLDEEFQKSINESLDELQLSEKAKKTLQPDIIRLQGLQKVNLNQALRKRRGEWEAQSINTAADKAYQAALNSATDEEFKNNIGLLKGIILGTEGTFVTQDKRDDLIRSKVDSLVEARVKTLAQDPTVAPEDLKKIIDSVEISGELYGNLNYIIENRSLAQTEDSIFYGVTDLIQEAQANPNFDLNIIRAEISTNKTVLGRPLTMSLTSMVEGLQNERDRLANATGVEKARIIGEMAERKAVLDSDYDGAIAYLQENRSAFENESDYLDAENRILAAKKSALDEENTSGLMANVPVFTSRIIKGEFTDLTSDQFKALVDTEILVSKTLPKSSRYQLQQSFEMQKLEAWKDQQEIEVVKQLAEAGIRPDNEKVVERLWNSVPDAHTDENAFKSFIDTYGVHKVHTDAIKSKLFDSEKAEDFYTGVIQGMAIWNQDPKRFKSLFDEESQKAIFWGYDSIRRTETNDYTPDPNDPTKQVYSPDQNIKNARKRVMDRLFPSSESLGMGNKTLKDLKVAKIDATANEVLDNVFPTYGAVKRNTLMFPALNNTLKNLYGFVGSKTAGTRSQAGFNVLDNMPPISSDAREFFSNLVVGKMLDGVTTDPKKAAEIALPEFLDTYGISRIGTAPGKISAYWQVAPPEYSISKMYSSEQWQAKQNAIDFFTDKVYEKVLDVTSRNPQYDTSHFYRGDVGGDITAIMSEGLYEPPEEKTVIPPVRLIPQLQTLNNPMPDYFVTIIDKENNVVPLMDNGQQVVIKGQQMIELITKYADQYGYEKGRKK